MLKNAKYIRNAAPHIIPSPEPLDGFKSLVPLDILRRFNGMSDAELATWPELLAVKQTLRPRPELAMQPRLFGDPPFKGTLHIVKLIFFTEADGGTITIDDSDIATVLEYTTLAAVPISAYCSQYGSNRLEVSPNILQFGPAVPNALYNDDRVRAMVNSILEQNHLDADSSCIILLNPPGMTNTDADPADGVLGYHDKANSPYCFVNVLGAGLTVADRRDLYADSLSHEIAEMTCDPDASIFNHEVCDGCAGNCKNSWHNFFAGPSLSLTNPLSYLQSSKTFPAAPFTYFIASIAARPHADDCPAPDGACAYGPPIPPVTVPGQAQVWPVTRSSEHLDVFVTDISGNILTAAWEPDFADGWHGWWRIGNLVAPQGAPVHCVSRSTDHLDIFVTDSSGNIQTAAWEPDFADGWHGWWPINGGRAAPGAPVTAVTRSADHLDVFVVGTDGHVYTAAWEPDFADGWHGWWRMST